MNTINTKFCFWLSLAPVHLHVPIYIFPLSLHLVPVYVLKRNCKDLQNCKEAFSEVLYTIADYYNYTLI